MRESATNEGWGTRLTGAGLDFKLGLRMLAKYPGLTVVSVLSMSTAVAIVAGFMAFSANLSSPKLPLDEGDRLVAIQNWDVSAGAPEPRTLWDFARWQDELRSIEGLGVLKPYANNLITEDGRSVPVRGSEMSASAFADARVPPLMGRALVEADEQAGAQNVAVVGYDLWRRTFGGDPSAVGSTVRLGSSPFTVVGVMPKGFHFPYSDNVWVPLRDDPRSWAPREGPPERIIGRLGEGFSLREARAELTTVGLRAASAFPEHTALSGRASSPTRRRLSLFRWSPELAEGGSSS